MKNLILFLFLSTQSFADTFPDRFLVFAVAEDATTSNSLNGAYTEKHEYRGRVGYLYFKPDGTLTSVHYLFKPIENKKSWALTYKHPNYSHETRSQKNLACTSDIQGKFRVPAYSNSVSLTDIDYTYENNILTITIDDIDLQFIQEGEKWNISTTNTLSRAKGYAYVTDVIYTPSVDWDKNLKSLYYTESVISPHSGDKWLLQTVNSSINTSVLSPKSFSGDNIHGVVSNSSGLRDFSQSSMLVNGTYVKSIMYSHIGYIYNNKNHPEDCYSIDENSGHLSMFFGAWDNTTKKYKAFVGIENSYEFDGFPIWGLIHWY